MGVDSFISKYSGYTEAYYFYNGEVELRYEPVKHIYLLVTPDGLVPQDGVTNVCHILDKSEALVPWACKMMEQKLLRIIPTLDVEDCYPIVPAMRLKQFEKLVGEAKSAHKDVLEDAGDVGHDAHAWIERQIKAAIAAGHGVVSQLPALEPLPQEPRSANCCIAGTDWMRLHNVRWRSTERKIYSRKHGYAGTMDGLCYVDSCDNPTCCTKQFKDRLTVADWKTSNGLYMEFVMQTAAYEHAFEEETGEDVTDRWVLRLGKHDGEFDPWHFESDMFPLHFRAFIRCLETGRDVKMIKEDIKQRERVIKDAKKAEAKAERDAANRIACPKSKTYKGVRKSTCNDTLEQCQACASKYQEYRAAKVS